jgi:hypothetical protein
MSSPHAHDFGPVGDEAAKLLEAVQGWARATFGEGASARISTGGPDCGWCPVCQLVAALRGERPELTEKIVEAGSTLMIALRALLERPAPNGDAQAPRVQRIDLDET